MFHLIPYGLEDDAGKSATLEIEVEISRKTRTPMHSATKIRLSVFVQEMKEDGKVLARHDNIEQSIDVSRFFISQFLTHECLKHSRCDQIEIQASAELIPHSEHPHTPKKLASHGMNHFLHFSHAVEVSYFSLCVFVLLKNFISNVSSQINHVAYSQHGVAILMLMLSVHITA